MKDLGFKYSTVAGRAISAFDVDIASKQTSARKRRTTAKRYIYVQKGLTTTGT